VTRILLVSGSTYEASVQSAALRTAARMTSPDVALTLFDGLRDLPAFVPGQRTPPTRFCSALRSTRGRCPAA
jgi:NAD(P)H-dependent FMN reductase